MLVEDLIEELRHMPPTAVVEVQIRTNVITRGRNRGARKELDEWRTAPVVTVVYDLGVVEIELDE